MQMNSMGHVIYYLCCLLSPCHPSLTFCIKMSPINQYFSFACDFEKFDQIMTKSFIHRSDSSQSFEYIAIFVSLISGLGGKKY